MIPSCRLAGSVRLAGALLVFGLAAAGRAEDALLTVDGLAAGDFFGLSVSYAGDLDGDGVPDLVVGAPYSQWDVGYVRVFSGADGSLLYHFSGAGSERFGRSVSDAGDANLDGVPDIIVGAPRYAPVSYAFGRAVVLSGKDGATLHTLVGTVASQEFGDSVSGAGDADQDGYADVVIGIPHEPSLAWGALLVSGKTGGALHYVSDSNVSAPIQVADAGDTDLDGSDDFVVGAPGQASGRVHVFSGATGQALRTFKGLASSVDGADDVDGDGHADVLVSAQGGAGLVRVYSVRTGAVLREWEGQAGEGLGSAVHRAGDVNGDGAVDFILGASAARTAYVVSAADGSVLHCWAPGPEYGYFGLAVGGGADLDGDGLDDPLAGAAGWNVAQGRVMVFPGSCCASFGFGCAGPFEKAPRLEMTPSCPVAGQPLLLRVMEAEPGAWAFLLLGSGPGLVPLGGGCALNLAAPAPGVLVAPVGSYGSAAGVALFGGPTPASASGLSLAAQAFVAAGGVAPSFSNTNGLAVRFK